MIDCVASYHVNQWTCGVARFNARLAHELGVALTSLPVSYDVFLFNHVLLSVKIGELPQSIAHALLQWCRRHPGRYDLFLHDMSADGDCDELARKARRVYVANAELACAISNRCLSTQLYCPSTVPVADLSPMTRIITFGMGHKLAIRDYHKLKDILCDRQYALGVSMAMHDGQEWDTNMAELESKLRPIFGASLHMFGYLADAALSATLQTATACAMFFEGGVRANNTTLWAALEHGCPVITNLDQWSPPGLVHGFNVFDISELMAWPTNAALSVVAHNGTQVAERYSWARLVDVIRG